MGAIIVLGGLAAICYLATLVVDLIREKRKNEKH